MLLKGNKLMLNPFFSPLLVSTCRQKSETISIIVVTIKSKVKKHFQKYSRTIEPLKYRRHHRDIRHRQRKRTTRKSEHRPWRHRHIAGRTQIMTDKLVTFTDDKFRFSDDVISDFFPMVRHKRI